MARTNHLNKKKSNFNTLRIGKIALALGLSLMLSTATFAQDPNGDPDTPFDGGISLLAAAGVAYGVKQWKDSRKKNMEEKTDI